MQNFQDTNNKPKVELKPKQAIAWEFLTNPKYADIRDIGFGGAAAGGKSFLGATWIIYMATKHANTSWCVGRKRKIDLQNTVRDKFFEVLKVMGFKQGVDFEYHIKDMVFKFIESGSTVTLLHLTYEDSDPQAEWLGGYEFTGAWLDESAEIDPRIIETLETRLGRVGNTKIVDGKVQVLIPTKILQTFNPSQGHVYTKFWIPYKEKNQTTTRFIRSFVYDNYPPGHPYIKNMEAMPEGMKKDRLLYGSFEFNTSEAALINPDLIDAAFNLDIQSKAKPFKMMVIDVSYSGADEDKTTYGIFDVYPEQSGWLYNLYDVDFIEHESTEELLSKVLHIRDKYGILNEHIVIDANGAGDGLARSERLDGCVYFMAHRSSIKYEVDNVVVSKRNKNTIGKAMVAKFDRLRDQCIWVLAEKLNQQRFGISIVNDGLLSLIRQELLIYEDVNYGTDAKVSIISKKDIRKEIGRSTDLTDLMYMAMLPELTSNEVKQKRPRSERKFLKAKIKKINYV